MEYITLNNGVEMPVLGYGTYQTPSRITERCVADALRVGYRSIDTAQCYGNEQEVGIVCRKSGIARSELLLQQGIVVIPKSTHTLRMEENFAALDFDLESDEMRKIEQLEIGKSLFGWW